MLARTLLVCLLAALAAAALDHAVYVTSFDQMWSRIRETHWDPAMNGVDWDAARAELRPRLLSAKTRKEALALFADLLARLRQSHFELIPAEAYAALQQDAPDEGSPGLDFRLLDGQPVITRGPRQGWTIRRIGPDPSSEIAAKTGKYAWHALHRRLRGKPGDTLTLELANGRQTALQTLALQPAPRTARFGHLPPIPVEIERRPLPGPAVYLRLSAFFEPAYLQEEMRAAVRDARSAAGFVLDLRGNPGGLAILAPAVAAWFLDKPASLGAYRMKNVTLQLAVNPRLEPFLGKLAILIDRYSMSTSEFLAAGLKDLGRARLFGETTAGAALPSAIEKLPTGDAFQFATAHYTSASGAVLEGAGVTPHVAVAHTRTALLQGRDLALEAALNWIQEKENKP
ncbi:MAG: S41 family peptidase [Bryobacteraceae bacterium]|nr:S41 family peptidase [Bryobacteraceae bacterium]